jgi:hypothetical protein
VKETPKTKRQLLLEVEGLRKKLEAAEQRRQDLQQSKIVGRDLAISLIAMATPVVSIFTCRASSKSGKISGTPQRSPQYIEVPPNMVAHFIVSTFRTILSF